jgi:FkbM family methyltransferase
VTRFPDLDDTAYGELACSPYARLSFAQEGEDLLAADWLLQRRQGAGFYVDIGAHHPQRFSNTYLFYLAGWRGLNVDATPGSMSRFMQRRPRDINVECAVSDRREDIECFLFDEPALNTLSTERVRFLAAETPFKPTGSVMLTALRLDELLGQHLPEGQAIDLMSVDVEGMDERVLRSNDWQRFRPSLLIVEDHTPIDQLAESTLHQILAGLHYRPIAKLPRSAIYADGAGG